MPNSPEWLKYLHPIASPVMLPLGPGSLTSGWHVSVRFNPWQQPEGAPALTREETYGWKPQIRGLNGHRSVGEIELAMRLRAAGLKSYWIDTFGSAPSLWRPFIAKHDELPSHLANRLGEIQRLVGRKARGAPDIVAWASDGSAMHFVEYKGPKDRIRDGQDAWLRAALDIGISADDYCVAKWDGLPA